MRELPYQMLYNDPSGDDNRGDAVAELWAECEHWLRDWLHAIIRPVGPALLLISCSCLLIADSQAGWFAPCVCCGWRGARVIPAGSSVWTLGRYRFGRGLHPGLPTQQQPGVWALRTVKRKGG